MLTVIINYVYYCTYCIPTTIQYVSQVILTTQGTTYMVEYLLHIIHTHTQLNKDIKEEMTTKYEQARSSVLYLSCPTIRFLTDSDNWIAPA